MVISNTLNLLILLNIAVGGGTGAYEALLERKRAALRRALKSEYLKKMYNPKSYSRDGAVEVHDAAIMRFHAMQKTVPEYWKPNTKSFIVFACLVGIPIGGHYFLHKWDREDFERKCRSGEYAYDDVKRSQKWWSTV